MRTKDFGEYRNEDKPDTNLKFITMKKLSKKKNPFILIQDKKEKWFDLLPNVTSDIPTYMMENYQEGLDNDLARMRYINPRNVTKQLRIESYEKWGDIYELNLTWLRDSSELSENEALQRVLKELWEDLLLKTVHSISFFLACGNEVRINLEVKETRDTYSWTLEPNGEIDFSYKENKLRPLYHLLKEVQDIQE